MERWLYLKIKLSIITNLVMKGLMTIKMIKQNRNLLILLF